jgi:hypothetical protein
MKKICWIDPHSVIMIREIGIELKETMVSANSKWYDRYEASHQDTWWLRYL